MSDVNKIVKVKKDEDGKIVEIMFDDGCRMSLNQAILMAKDGALEGVTVVRGKDGGEFLRIDPYDPNDPYEDDEDIINRLPTYK